MARGHARVDQSLEHPLWVLRVAFGFTQRSLGKDSDIHFTLISRIESWLVPTYEQIVRLAKVFDLQPEHLARALGVTVGASPTPRQRPRPLRRALDATDLSPPQAAASA